MFCTERKRLRRSAARAADSGDCPDVTAGNSAAATITARISTVLRFLVRIVISSIRQGCILCTRDLIVNGAAASHFVRSHQREVYEVSCPIDAIHQYAHAIAEPKLATSTRANQPVLALLILIRIVDES